jgi:hypothetical protein
MLFRRPGHLQLQLGIAHVGLCAPANWLGDPGMDSSGPPSSLVTVFRYEDSSSVSAEAVPAQRRCSVRRHHRRCRRPVASAPRRQALADRGAANRLRFRRRRHVRLPRACALPVQFRCHTTHQRHPVPHRRRPMTPRDPFPPGHRELRGVLTKAAYPSIRTCQASDDMNVSIP